MIPKVLVIDEFSVQLINSSISPTDEWFQTFNTVDREGRIKSSIIGEVAIIRSSAANSSSRLLVVNLGDPSVFERFQVGHKREVLRRIFVSSLCSFTNNVVIPRAWGCFNSNSRISFHALPVSAKKSYVEADTRIELDRNPFGTDHVYAYAFPLGWNELSDSLPPRAPFDSGVKAFAKFLLTAWDDIDVESHPGVAIELSDDSFFYQENSTGFDDWYKLRLTARQRSFVDAPLTSPIRLRGAAGTGKTQALAIKLLMTGKRALEKGESVKILFLTHSTATSEAVSSLLGSLDNVGIISRLRTTVDCSVEVKTLLEVAMEAVGADLERDRVLPLASDAREGRQLQLELIESLISEYVASNDWRLMRGLASSHFVNLMESKLRGGSEFRRFAWEMMNEFACVLDADGIQSKPALRKQYVAANRQAWMMPLPEEADRKIVLHIYDRFNEEIRDMRAISVDQVITDYLNYLDSFRWNAVRDKRGFDVIFVDELHLFNRQERMVLHGLTRSSECLALFMAYDAKQAPSDTFMPNEDRESSSSFWGRLKMGSINKVDLDQVFRYTPEIAKFVASLDQSFPALDLGDDWGEYAISSRVQSAKVPTLTVLSNDTDTYSHVMERARILKRKGGQRISVAVLCCNGDHFDAFRAASAHKKDFIAISSREEAGVARPDAFRFVLSTPEYVAGLQFDCVMLLDVNAAEIPSGPYSGGARRKFISTVYLGASRAMRHLEVYSTTIEGGPAGIIDNAINVGAIRDCAWLELPAATDIAGGL